MTLDPSMIDKMVVIDTTGRDNVSSLDIFNKNDQEFLIKAGHPVLLIGPHGVGKTSVLRSIATNFNLKMHELNASTLDPFVHIVGLPVINDGTVTMDPPNALMEAELLFIDEVNRSDRPTRNALFELICDKSVNGKKLPNLKLIVAAMNPPDEGYQVDALDEAMDDRFLYKFNVKRDISYALNLIDDEKQRAAVEKWYGSLDAPPSPRRLTWVIESAFGETINEAALLNALDDTRYGSKALLRMLSTEDHGPDTESADPLLSEDERIVTSKVIASVFLNHKDELTNDVLDELEQFRNSDWMPDPATKMELTDIKKVYEGSDYIKQLEGIFPFNVMFIIDPAPHSDGWIGRWIDQVRT